MTEIDEALTSVETTIRLLDGTALPLHLHPDVSARLLFRLRAASRDGGTLDPDLMMEFLRAALTPASRASFDEAWDADLIGLAALRGLVTEASRVATGNPTDGATGS